MATLDLTGFAIFLFLVVREPSWVANSEDGDHAPRLQTGINREKKT